MKILYGVQATGNGHITRARAMNKALKQKGIDVDYLFSGRQQELLFDMEEFGNFRCCRGLTFVTQAGSVQIVKTIIQNSLIQLYKDIQSLDLDAYDLILTDFEPISAWAAKKQYKKSIALGHQYAFEHDIPKAGDNFMTRFFMQHFAPATIKLGLHWHHFDQPILPPIAETHPEPANIINNKIVVYLGFESPEEVICFIEPFNDYQFHVYGNFSQELVAKSSHLTHIILCPLSREGFKADLASCNGVISNAGFELGSEAIHLGKKLLVKPLKGQMEQLSNAVALEKLGLGTIMETLDFAALKHWLTNFEAKRISYPDVPAAIANWIVNGIEDDEWISNKELADELWGQVELSRVKPTATYHQKNA